MQEPIYIFISSVMPNHRTLSLARDIHCIFLDVNYELPSKLSPFLSPVQLSDSETLWIHVLMKCIV